MTKKFNPAVGFFLILALGIPRFVLVLQANETHNYRFVPLIFLVMILLPFVLLRTGERKEIGLKRPLSFASILVAFLAGVLACSIFYGAAVMQFDFTVSNAFVYISNSYPVLSDVDKFTFFFIATIPSMIFSPLGEEFFYRGWVHKSFASRLGYQRASYVDGAAFALTHLAHFGIVYVADRWQFLTIPSLIWVAEMFLVSLVFSFFRRKSDSIWGAVACHAGFNAAMSYFIVYEIL